MHDLWCLHGLTVFPRFSYGTIVQEIVFSYSFLLHIIVHVLVDIITSARYISVVGCGLCLYYVWYTFLKMVLYLASTRCHSTRLYMFSFICSPVLYFSYLFWLYFPVTSPYTVTWQSQVQNIMRPQREGPWDFYCIACDCTPALVRGPHYSQLDQLYFLIYVFSLCVSLPRRSIWHSHVLHQKSALEYCMLETYHLLLLLPPPAPLLFSSLSVAQCIILIGLCFCARVEALLLTLYAVLAVVVL